MQSLKRKRKVLVLDRAGLLLRMLQAQDTFEFTTNAYICFIPTNFEPASQFCPFHMLVAPDSFDARQPHMGP